MFWRKRILAIALEYPDVELSHMYVDNAAMQLVRNPKQVRLWFHWSYPSFIIKIWMSRTKFYVS